MLRTGSQRDGTLGCRSGTRYHRRRTTLSRAERLGSTCGRHDEETDDECVGLHLKQGVFPSMIITNALIQMVGKIADENGKVDIITNRSCDGVDYE